MKWNTLESSRNAPKAFKRFFAPKAFKRFLTKKMRTQGSECIFVYWSLSQMKRAWCDWNLVVKMSQLVTLLHSVSPQFITGCQLHQHTCWVDRCYVQPPCAAMTDPHYAHSTVALSHNLPALLSMNIERSCQAHVNTASMHAKTGSEAVAQHTASTCHLPGIQLSGACLQLCSVPFPNAVQLWLFKVFLLEKLPEVILLMY